jgi:hypothetical protein
MPTLPVHLTDFAKEKPAQVKASFVYERRKAQGRVSQKTNHQSMLGHNIPKYIKLLKNWTRFQFFFYHINPSSSHENNSRKCENHQF